jgi:flagellar biosynthetic protein FliP
MSRRCFLFPTSAGVLAFIIPSAASAATSGIGQSDPVRIGVILTIMAVIPAIVMTMTSFIRIIIVLSMIRHAFGMPETPPNSVLVSLALFLAAFSMGPVVGQIQEQAVSPFLDGRVSVETMLERGSGPLKAFMLQQTRESDIATIYAIAGESLPATPQDVELLKLAPAFIINELRVAFTIGFVILLPFLLIDLVVSAILLSLGMMMVPPATISLPVKILMFVLIDGWALLIEGLMGSFR